MIKFKSAAVVICLLMLLSGKTFAKKPPIVRKIDNLAQKFSLPQESKRKILEELRKHVLSYSHLERKTALYDIPENLYYRLSDISLAQLEDKDFFKYIMEEFSRQKDSHTRFHFPDYMSCRKASVPIEFRFFRDSKDDGWGKIIVYDIGDRDIFKGVEVGDELVQYENFEMKPFFEEMRQRIAQSPRGFNEAVAANFLGEIDGRFLPMPKRDRVYMLFRDHRTGIFKEIEVEWDFDYSACSNVALYKGLDFQDKSSKKKKAFKFQGTEYSFDKIANPQNITEELFVAGTITRKGVKTAPVYGYIKFLNFSTFEDRSKGETVNEFIDNALVALANLMNIFSDKGVEGLIIDTRMNPGGWVEFAHHIARIFSRGPVRSVVMQFANGEKSLENLLREIADTEKEIESIRKRGIWSGLPYTRKFFNWDDYRNEIEKSRSSSLRLAKGLPHFKEPTQGLNPLDAGKDFPKVVITDQYCYSSCDMFVALMKDNRLSKIVGETTRGGGGMVHDGSIEVFGRLESSKKKIPVKVPYRYAYTNVLTPDFEIIEDRGVNPDLYYRSDLKKFIGGEMDSGWIDKAATVLKK